MSILVFEQVSKSYFGKLVLDQISLRLDAAERLALIGQNGAGKTTMLRLAMGLEKPDQGTVSLAGHSVPGYLSQHFSDDDQDDQTPLQSKELQQIEQAMRGLEQAMQQAAGEPDHLKRLMARYSDLTARFEIAGGYAFTHEMQEMAAGLGLPEDCLKRPLRTLSGGERMRVALARILLRSPDLLLLDEPTNHLDLQAMEWLESYLKRYKGSVLLVTHDRTFMNQVATSVAELSQGKVTVRPGNYSRFMALKAAEMETIEREMKNKARELARQKEVKQTLLSHRDISGYHAREKVVSRLSGELARIRDQASRLGHRQRLSFRLVSREGYLDDKKALLKAENLTKAYQEEPLFTADRLEVRSREKIGLCGPNGCGKTTLLQIFLGLLPASSGLVELDSQTVYGHLSQHARFDDESMTLLDTVLGYSDLSEGDARTLLAHYGFSDTSVYKSISVLSGGEKARLYLCCLLLEEPNLLFLDEPTNHLDIASREILEQAISDYQGAMLAVSHDRYFLERCCDRIYGFVDRQVRPFSNYEAYRRAMTERKSGQNEILPPATSVKKTDDTDPSDTTGRAQKNPAMLRRQTARIKQTLREAEERVKRLEIEKQEWENRLGQEAEPQDYELYAALLEELETSYDRYMQLAEELESGDDE